MGPRSLNSLFGIFSGRWEIAFEKVEKKSGFSGHISGLGDIDNESQNCAVSAKGLKLVETVGENARFGAAWGPIP